MASPLPNTLKPYQDALSRGVPSVVLRADCPTSDRKKISLLLNRLHGIQWEVDGDAVRLDVARAATVSGSQFEAMSKNLDAEELRYANTVCAYAWFERIATLVQCRCDRRA